MALKNLLDWIETKRFRIYPSTSLSTTNLEDGKFEYKDGILYVYDGTRAKWLSVQRQTLIFGRSGTTADQYLNFAGGGISSQSGYNLMRNAVVTGITVRTSTTDNYKIHLRKNDDDTNKVTLIAAGYSATATSANTTFYVGDYLQCFLEYNGAGFGVDNPVVMIEFAWRG